MLYIRSSSPTKITMIRTKRERKKKISQCMHKPWKLLNTSALNCSQQQVVLLCTDMLVRLHALWKCIRSTHVLVQGEECVGTSLPSRFPLGIAIFKQKGIQISPVSGSVHGSTTSWGPKGARSLDSLISTLHFLFPRPIWSSTKRYFSINITSK